MTSKKMVLGGILAFFMSMLLVFSVGLLTGNLFDRSGNKEQSIALTEGDWWINDGVRGTGFDGGDGSPEHPYEIRTAEQLAYLSYMVYTGSAPVTNTNYYYSGAYFKQTANIDLSAHYWQPIGINDDREGNLVNNYFSGNYDGDGHTVSGINTPSGSTSAYSYQGLFGYVYGQSSNRATITNVGVIDSNIQGYDFVGGIVGGAYYVTISNSYNKASVTGSSRVGGIAGFVYSSYSTITNCYNTGSVTGSSSYVGGIAGYVSSSTITNCYNTGSVTGSGSNVGGIIGDTSYSSNVIITNCYNTGTVTLNSKGTGTYYVGGIAGYGSPTNCFNLGEVTGTGSGTVTIGGITGNGTATNCYYGGDCTLEGYSDTLVTDARNIEWYNNIDETWSSDYAWDFYYLWDIVAEENDGLPIFAKGTDNWILDGFYDTTWEGKGTTEEPYLISTPQELAGLSYVVYYGTAEEKYINGDYYFSGVYFKQTANIDLSAHYWQPIGIYYDRNGAQTQHYFSGIYNGDGYTVSGINTVSGITNAYSYQGLFGYVYGQNSTNKAEIKNVGVINSNIQGYSSVGGIVGYVSSYSTITNCYNTGSVTGSSSYVGGIVGRAYSSTITNCYNTGSVTGSASSVGGIVGYTDSYTDSNKTITNCYNTGSVTGSSRVGGIAGDGSPANCFNLGEVTGTGGETINIGGITGDGTATNCYYGGDCTLEGYSETLATDAKNIEWYKDKTKWTNDFDVVIWDFICVWELDETINDGYPYLDPLDWWLSDSTYYDTTWEGEGTQKEPFLISTAQELAGLSYVVYSGTAEEKYINGDYYFSGVYFKQTADIDLSEHYWQPIGISDDRYGNSVQHYFSGKYDGDGHTVSGIKTPAGSSRAYSYQGLFGYVRGESSNRATITNVGVINSNIQGYDFVGGIVGRAYSSTITNCYNTGSVTGSGSDVGGIAGFADYDFSYIINCYNEGSVSGNQYIGGITGRNCDVNNCYNAGEIIGKDYVGGISGAGNTINNCYNTGRIESNSEIEENLSNAVGGICGHGSKIFNCYNEGEIIGVNADVGGVCGTINEIVFNCYNIGSVTGSDSVGGIVGNQTFYTGNAAIVSNCFNLGKVNATKSDAMYVGGISGRSVNLVNSYFGGACDLQGADQSLESNAKTQEWYQSNMLTWDFELIWTFNGSENGYPILNLSESPIGSWINPQYIDTKWEGAGTKQNPYLISTAEELAGLSYVVYYGTTDSQYSQYISGSYYFTGAYFKQTANIDLSAHYWQPIGIYYDRNNNPLYHYFSGSYDGGGFTISGMFTPAGTSRAFSYQGLFGYVIGESSTNKAEIKNVGVINSYIQGYSSVGGIVGYASSYSTITNCYSAATIISNGNNAGGITGNGGEIINCYNTGKIIGAEAVGGISGSGATVINSFNVGLVQRIDGSLTSVGGISGGNATIINSFYGGDCMLEGYTENLEILAKDQTWFENFLPSWSFDFIWKFVEGENNGYPVLNNEKLKLDSWLAKTTYYNTTWQGQGTQTDPYLITCAEDLAGLSYMVYNGNDFAGRYFKQTANIDLSAHQWQPIGVEKMNGQYVYRSFYGRYDGGGFTISGLFVLSNDSSQGLFGYVSATISNVGLINSYVQGGGYVGGISGRGGTIRNCFNSSTIIGNNYVGGITGNGSVSNCYNTGSVTSLNNYVGGIVGQTYSNDLNNCYNVGTISGTNYVGGISGYGNPINSFNLGKIQKSDSSANFGGITGSGTATNCYFGGDCNLDGSDPLLEENAKTQEWYDTKMTSWDFSFVWGFESQGSLPILNGGDNWIKKGNYSTTNWLGSGSKEDPFQIWTAEDLARLSYLVYYGTAEEKYINGNYYFSGVYFEQKADIDLSAHAWQPIGIYCDRNNDYLYRYFSGSYDGGNFKISGISTPSGSTNAYSYQGLFGYVDGRSSISAEIKNVGVINSYIQGYQYVGGIVGNASSNSIITNCYVAGNVFGSSYVGGIAGSGSVSNSSNASKVEGNSYVGGITGSGSQILNCYNIGNIIGNVNYIGGISGRPNVVMFSYNKGTVAGVDYVGGIAGQVESIAINTYNVGSVTATGTNVGGVAGSGNAMYSYYGGECGNIGAVAGSDIDGVSYLSNLSSIAKTIEWYQNESNWIKPWDFDVAWEISVSENDGYPILTGESESSTWLSDPSYYNVQSEWKGSGTEEDPYLISSAEDLAGLSYMVSSGELDYVVDEVLGFNCYYSGVYFKQTVDIDLSAHDWVPIGGMSTGMPSGFAGVYDGNGYTISGLNLMGGGSDSDMFQSLFGLLSGVNESTPAIVKNLAITDSLILNFGGYASSIAAYVVNAVIDNCTNYSDIIGNGYIGGIVTLGMNVTITNCRNEGKLTGLGGVVGGILTSSAMNVTIENCYNMGDIQGTAEIVAGIYCMPEDGGNISIINCYNFGEINVSSSMIGGVVAGAMSTSSTSCYIDTCANFGNITSSAGNAIIGGVVGSIQVDGETSQFTLKNCYSKFTATLNEASFVGGVIGQSGGDYSSFTGLQVYNCASDVTIVAEEGMILGQGALYVEMDGVAVPFINSYGFINGVLTITDETNAMDGNFAYLENFNDGKPVPIGIYYILDYGITTGIVDQINSLT